MGQCVQSTQGSTWQRWWTEADAGLIFASGGGRSLQYLFQSNGQILFKITTKRTDQAGIIHKNPFLKENPVTPEASRLLSNKQHAKWEGAEEVKLHRIHSSILTGPGGHSTSPGLGLDCSCISWLAKLLLLIYYYQLLSWNHELNYPNERGNQHSHRVISPLLNTVLLPCKQLA